MNREHELRALGEWWADADARLALLWGRRRVGKTALLHHFGMGKRLLFHTAAGRPLVEELRVLSRVAAGLPNVRRDLERRPFADWDDAFDELAVLAAEAPLLVVLDEFPELLRNAPELPGVLRAFLDRVPARPGLKLLLSGSAVRVMEGIQEERAPLYGRVDLSLLLHPFQPRECAAMLDRLTPPERALVWGLVGGVPLYLKWWDQEASVRDNLARLVCRPGARLLAEGELVLATEGDTRGLTRGVLHALAAGKTRHHEIGDAVRADPTRTLDRLVRLRLVDRVVPVTEDARRTRRRIYRIADNFLAFWLGIVDRHRSEIERGLGETILPIVLQQLDDHMGQVWEEAYRIELRRLAVTGVLGPEVVAIGPFWREGTDPAEIDAVVLAGRQREAILIGEAKWARQADAARIRRHLEARLTALPRPAETVRFSVCARETVTGGQDMLVLTAADIFAG